MRLRLLDRYLLRELVLPLAYCLAGFTIFWVCFTLSQELGDLQRDHLSGSEILLFYLYTLPENLPVVLPVALLLALLYALTNHARNHELIAMRAAGISLWRISLPYFAVGAAASLALFATNEWLAPNGLIASEQLRERHRTAANADRPDTSGIERNFGFDSANGTVWEADVYDTRTGAMEGVHLSWRQPDGTRRDVVAKRGAWADGRWVFHDVVESIFTNASTAFPVRRVVPQLELRELRETPDQIRASLKVRRLAKNPRSASKRPQLSITEIQEYQRLHPEDIQRRAMLQTQLHGRLAAPWTCLVVVCIALPFGAPSGRRNAFVGVAASVFICFAYFIISRLGLTLGTSGRLPGWIAAWAPNLLFGGIGLWLTHRLR